MTISAKIILDSVTSSKRAPVRLTTMELTYPRFIHSEFMTHRQFSRNAASSRAIPIEKMIQMVEDDPAMPVRWGVNGKGMQDHGEMTKADEFSARCHWLAAKKDAVYNAREMLKLPVVPHKQIVNRILEPFMHITVLVSATEYANFFHLRKHKDADPTIQALAEQMWIAFNESTPSVRRYGEHHLPFIDDETIDAAIKHHVELMRDGAVVSAGSVEDAVTSLTQKISVARCARVSYLTHDKRRPEIIEDLNMFERLMVAQPLHASPAEHQATPDMVIMNGDTGQAEYCSPYYHGNFVGWVQFRKTFVGEAVSSHPKKPKTGVLIS